MEDWMRWFISDLHWLWIFFSVIAPAVLWIVVDETVQEARFRMERRRYRLARK